MTIDIIAIADDFQFCEAWRAMSDEDRAAMPLGLRTRCFCGRRCEDAGILPV